MKEISIKDDYGDELQFGIEPDGIVVVTRTKDVDDVLRTGVVEINEAQARKLYMWLAEAIGVVDEGYNERHGG